MNCSITQYYNLGQLVGICGEINMSEYSQWVDL